MKLFNKFVSIVTVVAFVLSMMAVPAFAADGVAGFQTATGNEAVKVTYYSDAVCENPITTAEPGATVYAKMSVNVPSKSFGSLNVVMSLDNVTAIEEVTADLYSSVIGSHFERPALANSASASSVTLSIAKKAEATALHNSPTDYASFKFDVPQYTYIGVESFDVCIYKLTIASTEDAVIKFAKTGGTGISIGACDDSLGFMGIYTMLENEVLVTDVGLTAKTAASEPVITYSYDATIAATKVDPELDDAAYEAAVKALVTVTKTTKTDDEVTGTETVAAKAMVVDKAAKTVTVTFADDTTKVLNYTEMEITYGTPSVELASSFDYAKTASEIADEVVVTVVKTKDGVDSTLTLDADDYDVAVTFDADANTGKAVVTFKGDYAANTAVEKDFARTNAPVSYEDVVATISGSPFAFGTTEDQIKAAIAVKGTKVEGVVETDDVTVPADLYEITVDLDAKTATVAMLDGTAVENADLTFEISEETFTYSNYAVEYTGEAAYDYTTTENIAGKVKVTATKTSNENPANTETVDLTNEVEITVDKDADTITVTWKAESAHAGAYTFQDITVTFNDVIEYKNASATMSKTSFAEGTSEADILAEVVVTLEKLVNGTKDDTFVPAIDEDYIVTYADDEVTVDFVADGIANVVIPVTFYSASAVTAKVVLDTTTVADGKVTLGNDYVAYIELDGLTSAYGGEFTLSVNKGTIKTVEAATGYTINNVPAVDVASTTVEYTKAIGDDGITAGARVLKVTVSTVGTAKDDVVTLKVDSMKVSQVEDFDINELPTQTSEAKADVTIDQFVRAMSVELPKLEIGIVTLGTLNDDKYVDGVSIDGIDLTDKVSVDAAGRKLVIEDVVLDGSATEDEVTYTLKVVVPGYTTIEADIVIEYVSDENAVDYNTWKIKSNEITTDSKIYAGDVAGDDNTIAADDYSDIVAVYGDAVTTLYDLYEGGDVVDQKDIITMVWAFEQYGMTQVTAAGIIE